MYKTTTYARYMCIMPEEQSASSHHIIAKYMYRDVNNSIAGMVVRKSLRPTRCDWGQ